MNTEQARMARALTGKGMREIAEMAGVMPNTISRLENGGDPKHSTVVKLQQTYEALGVQFLSKGDVTTGFGVCFKEPSSKDDEWVLFDD